MTTSAPPPLQHWRTQALRRLSVILSVVGLLPMLGVTWAFLQVQRPLAALAIVALWVACSLLLFQTNRLSYATRVWGLMAIMTAVLALTSANAGLSSGIGALMLMCVLLGVLFLNLRSGLFVLAVQCGTLLAVAYCIEMGLVPPPTLEVSDDGNVAIWPARLTSLIWISVVVAVGAQQLLSELAGSIRRSTALVAELQAEMAARARAVQQREQAEAHLAKAQKLEALGQLAGGIAHDFNNSLTVITTAASLLQEDLTHEESPDLVAQIIEAAEGGGAMVRELLAFGRRDVMVSEPVDLAATLARTGRVLKPLLGSRISVSTHCAEGLPPVLVDRAHLDRVLLNLALNARDAMPSGGSLRLSATRCAVEPGARSRAGTLLPDQVVTIEVADTGTGIAPAVLPQIFEPLFTTKAAGQGTGLGLSFTDAFVERSGGRARVESTVGEGTRILLDLPPVAEGAAASPALQLRPPDSTGEHVLLVEDNDAIRAIMARTLRLAGYIVYEQADGQQGLAAIEAGAERYAMLCTDSRLPGVRGEALAARYRALHPAGAVLVCSGSVATTELLTALEAGEYAFLSKPFKTSAFLRAAQEALQGAQAAAISSR